MSWFLIAFGSAIFSASAAITEKKVLLKLDALSFSLYVSFFGAILSIPFFFQVNYTSLSTTSLLILYLKTILGAFAFLNVMQAIKKLEISNALPLIILTPGLVAIVAFFILGDNLVLLEIIGMMLLLIGTYVLELNRSNENLLEPFLVLFKSKDYRNIIIALSLFTITSIMDRLLVTQLKVPPLTFMAFQQTFQFINFLIIYLFVHRNLSITFSSDQKSLLGYIILVSIFTIFYRWFHIEAVKLAPVALVLSVKRTSVLIASIIGGKIFNEKYLTSRITAAVIIIIGSILIINN